jgi:activator of 2-hydroxyglutaryl-CoA dehydratase
MGVIAGINIGSVTAKTVIMAESRKILFHSIVEEGIVDEASAKLSLTQALDLAGLGREEIRLIVTTRWWHKRL